MKWFTIAPEAYFFLLRRCVFFIAVTSHDPRSILGQRSLIAFASPPGARIQTTRSSSIVGQQTRGRAADDNR
jgi:hypothetical protein